MWAKFIVGLAGVIGLSVGGFAYWNHLNPKPDEAPQAVSSTEGTIQPAPCCSGQTAAAQPSCCSEAPCCEGAEANGAETLTVAPKTVGEAGPEPRIVTSEN